MDFEITPINKDNPPIIPAKKRPDIFNFGIQFVLLAAIFIIAIGVLFFFLRRSSFGEEKVELKIEGPEEITGGELLEYKVLYKNGSKVALEKAQLVFSYPDDSIVIEDGKVVKANNEVVDIGRINAGESGDLQFSAYIVGEKANIKQARAELTFEPSGIVSVIKKEVILPTTITSLPVTITLVAPPTAADGQEITYILDYRNQNDSAINDIRINIKTPESFKAINYSPSPTSGNGTWDINVIEAGEGSRISMLGSIKGIERESKSISATLQKKIRTDSGDLYIDFTRVEASTAIASPYISSTILANGSRDHIAGLGERIKYTIDFKNNTTIPLLGLNMSVKLEGSMFDLSSVRSEGFFDSRQNVIFWNSSTVPELGVLEPNQTARVEFEVQLNKEFPGGVFGTQNSLIKVSSILETENVPPAIALSRLIAEDELVTRISTTVSLGQLMFINDSQWGSSGPFPPKVNEKTTFTVKWSLINPANLITPAKITAVLAPGVSWEGRTRSSSGIVQTVYNPSNQTVTWDIGSLPGGVGSAFPPYETYFQISIVPSVNQVGQAVEILRDIKFEGVDSLTSQSITRTVHNLNINNSEDQKGGVVKP